MVGKIRPTPARSRAGRLNHVAGRRLGVESAALGQGVEGDVQVGVDDQAANATAQAAAVRPIWTTSPTLPPRHRPPESSPLRARRRGLTPGPSTAPTAAPAAPT